MRTLKYTGAAAALLLLAALALGMGLLRASLPRLDGALAEVGLTSAVRIARDSRGVPTIEAADRPDLAYATGFVHAQDRYFQMDLSRRLAAGELAELFGTVALEQDRRARLFRFRAVAREVIAQATAAERAVLEAYARGVNAGLADLAARPWEYWVLGQPPLPWRPEDTILIEHAMWWDLQASGLRREMLRQEINARLGGAQCGALWKCGLNFLYPAGTNWDAPVVPSSGGAMTAAQPPVPAAEVLDVRNGRAAATAPGSVPRAPAAGSNSWAVAGRLTTTGAALIANDMHLGLRVPPVWYHARLRTPSGAAGDELDLNGVTLPGAPLLVAGSNGHVAWGFTNSYGTWLDVTRVPCTAVGQHELTTPSGPVALSVVREEIRVHDEAPVVLEVKSAPAGVLLRADEAQHSCWFGSWLAQQPAATNLGLMALERATSVAEALALAPAVGIPHQNVVIGDAQGHIGWTIYGRIPEDTGPTRARGGVPWTTAADHPRIVDPPLGRIWTANARVASDDHQLQLIGGDVAALGAEYDLGARAGQIRDDLLALQANITPADMLRIQLDDRAVFLARWRTLLLSVLDTDALRDHPRRADFRRLIQGWNARASVDSVGYRLVRAYHERTRQAVWDMLLAGLGLEAEQGAAPPAQFEGPLWQLVTAQPLHLLAKTYPGWPQFLRAQVDATIAELGASCRQLAHCTWGAHSLVRIRHPLSGALPWLASFLDMPTLELPGDHDMPRVQDGAIFGASERFAVSPGHEEQGYLHLPGGQSGHPLSPYYRAGFTQWALGRPLPFLPGPAEHTLTLTPN
ncbi:MAG: penicillin acylase family protein [Gammaproteobacteria bacterium]|nr:MAG: penicillin acylase family protein [Gammaproteobacteria bacterium]